MVWALGTAQSPGQVPRHQHAPCVSGELGQGDHEGREVTGSEGHVSSFAGPAQGFLLTWPLERHQAPWG